MKFITNKTFKLGVIGSRGFLDYELAEKVYLDYFSNKIDTIVSGGAVGARSGPT